jgi:MFS family permease
MLDAMDFVIYLMAIPTLQQAFGFGPETAGLLATVALLTSAVGGVFFGYLADRLGRRRALALTILTYSVCSLGSATAGSLAALMVWRALLGFGMGGEWSAGAALVSETWPARHRGKAIGIMQSGWALGYILAAGLAALLLPTIGWRWLFAAGVLPALLTLWIRRHVPEPARWTEQAGRPPASVVRVLWSKAYRGRTATAIVMSAAVMFAYWGLFTWLPSFLASPLEKGGAGLGLVKSLGWIVPMQLGAFAGYLSFGFISDRLGRRPSFVAFLLVAALLVPVYGLGARSPRLLLVLGPVLGFAGHGYFSLFGAQLAELFPTSIRATAQGLTYNAGRAVSALAPFVIGSLARTQGIGPALLLTSGFFLLGALLVLLLPETRGAELRDEA